MGYNACYGMPCNDSMSEYELQTKHSETMNLFVTDCLGNVQVKTEFCHCAKCGKPLDGGEMVYLHGQEKFCRECELKHRFKNRKTKKGGK